MNKFLTRTDDVAGLGDILCKDSNQRPLTSGMFICAEGNAIFDARFASLSPDPQAKPVTFWVQTRHTNAEDPTSVSSSELCVWYQMAMASLANFIKAGYPVVLVFITNRKYRPRTTAYSEVFSRCPRLLLLANDLQGSLARFLGNTFAHRGLVAQ
jgi:hypothetical protein